MRRGRRLTGVKTPTDAARRVLYPAVFAGTAAAFLWHASRGGRWWGLLWPAVGFAAAALAYALGRPGVLGKRAGLWRLLPVLPYRWFALGVWHLHRRLGDRGAACDRLHGDLFVGRRPLAGDLPAEVAADPDAMILDLTAEFPDVPAVRNRPGYRCEPVLDAAAPSADELARIVSLLPPPGGPPGLIHCANGRGRTGLVAAAWVLAHGLAGDADAAVERVRTARPAVRLLPRQRTVLEEFVARPAPRP